MISLYLCTFIAHFFFCSLRSQLSEDIMNVEALPTPKYFTNTFRLLFVFFFSFLKHNYPFGCVTYRSIHSSAQHIEILQAFLCKAALFSSLILNLSIFPTKQPEDKCLLSFTALRYSEKLKH